MKRATMFKLALLGASALTLAACGEAQEEALTYTSVESCVKAGIHDKATCETEFEKAKKEHQRAAPRYANSGSCYSDFGYDRCYRQQTSSGSSIWLPFMMGYMLAPRGGSTIYTQPLYRPSDDPNRFYTAGNSRISNRTADGRSSVAASQTRQPQARTRTVARGGFGARATSSGS